MMLKLYECAFPNRIYMLRTSERLDEYTTNTMVLLSFHYEHILCHMYRLLYTCSVFNLMCPQLINGTLLINCEMYIDYGQ